MKLSWLFTQNVEIWCSLFQAWIWLAWLAFISRAWFVGGGSGCIINHLQINTSFAMNDSQLLWISQWKLLCDTAFWLWLSFNDCFLVSITSALFVLEHYNLVNRTCQDNAYTMKKVFALHIHIYIYIWTGHIPTTFLSMFSGLGSNRWIQSIWRYVLKGESLRALKERLGKRTG